MKQTELNQIHKKLQYTLGISLFIILLLIMFILLLMSGKLDRDKPAIFSNGLLETFKNEQIFAAIGITPDRKIILRGKNGEKGVRCSFNKNSKLKRCRGADDIIGFETINIMFTKGSFCAADPNRDGDADQYCFP